MILSRLTWQDVEQLSREIVVLLPTGSLEQHGPHLPLFTDSLLATAVAEAVEARIPESVLLTPTLWLGASGHHLAFSGSLSNDFDSYMGAIASIAESLIPHGFHKFFVLNGHGGNTEPNGMILRTLKSRHLTCTFGHSGCFGYATEVVSQVMEGPFKDIRHSCEAEVSLMMHLHPDLVRTEKLRDDGLTGEPPIRGLIHHFDEMTEQGSLGFATYANAEKGRAIFEASVDGVAREMKALAEGYVMRGV
ncbi:MAG: creatininase family protein [Fimbriimonas sp.]